MKIQSKRPSLLRPRKYESVSQIFRSWCRCVSILHASFVNSLDPRRKHPRRNKGGHNKKESNFLSPIHLIVGVETLPANLGIVWNCWNHIKRASVALVIQMIYRGLCQYRLLASLKAVGTKPVNWLAVGVLRLQHIHENTTSNFLKLVLPPVTRMTILYPRILTEGITGSSKSYICGNFPIAR